MELWEIFNVVAPVQFKTWLTILYLIIFSPTKTIETRSKYKQFSFWHDKSLLYTKFVVITSQTKPRAKKLLLHKLIGLSRRCNLI